MIINSISLISLILTIVLVVALIVFINQIILNKKLIKEKDNMENLGEMIYFMRLPVTEKKNEIERKKESYSHKETITKQATSTKIDPEFLERVTSIIYKKTNTDNLIEVISSELCISSSHLNRKIKLRTGMTTSKFILKTRLNRAKKQLTVTQKPIGEVAMDCGFNDFAYFSRSFKKEFDMTATTFQRMQHSLN